jgi:hypothetical protein
MKLSEMPPLPPLPPGCYHDGIGLVRCRSCFRVHPCGVDHDATFPQEKTTMRFFDTDKIGCYLDDIGHRVEKTKDGKEIRMVDLTLRVQPLTAELAGSLDADVRALLFNMGDALPKGKIKAIHFNLPVAKQAIDVHLLPTGEEGAILIPDVEISDVRARVEKGVDGYALVFYASFGPVGKAELEYVVGWHTQQRFLTFRPQEPALDFAGAPEAAAPTGGPRRVARERKAEGDDQPAAASTH